MEKLPGRQKTRHKARVILKYEQDGDNKNQWDVWGGENKHVVKLGGDKFICDCRAGQLGIFCSHVLKIQMVLGLVNLRPK
jgi:hypothetical protein